MKINNYISLLSHSPVYLYLESHPSYKIFLSVILTKYLKVLYWKKNAKRLVFSCFPCLSDFMT